MINDNIKKYRRKKGLTQEEMAKKLHVVRQTVSKWETGKSVPDAEVLIRMAEVLDVSVNELLGIESVQGNMDEVAEELIRVKERLEEQNRREILTKKVDEKRGIILLLSFFFSGCALCKSSSGFYFIIYRMYFGGSVGLVSQSSIDDQHNNKGYEIKSSSHYHDI